MKNLQKIRKLSGLSQSKLSELANVNLSMIQFYEQGVKDINKAEALTVYKLAQALNCRMEELLEFIQNWVNVSSISGKV